MGNNCCKKDRKGRYRQNGDACLSNFDSNAAGPTIVIFGASGDLTRRKLIPALYNNLIKKRLAAVLRIVGFARRDWRDDQFRDHRGSGVKKHATGFDARVWKEFSRNILYFQGDLATAPDFYVPACDHLSAAGMSVEQSGRRRIIIEKPFGHDLTSARALNRQVHAAFAEHQVYRIDHYLSKETAQAGWRRVVAPAVRLGIPVPAISAALAYFDGYRSARLPANLLQAQRDYFGAHTYERIDKPRGTFFHTNWTGHGGSTSSSTYDV